VIQTFSEIRLGMNPSTNNLMNRIAWRLIQQRIFDPVRPSICHTPVFCLEGITKRIETKLVSVVCGDRERVEYYSKLAYSTEPKISILGRISYHQLPSIINRLKPDIAFVDTNPIFSKFLLLETFFVLPYLVSILDLSGSLESILKKSNRTNRKKISKLAQQGLTYEITKDPEKLREFYYSMYIPRIMERHSEDAKIVSFSECLRLFNLGGLLLTKLNGETISGAIYVHQGKKLYVPIIGINTKREELAGIAGFAATYSLILMAKKEGYDQIDYGACKPFLNDGVFLYKKNWGMQFRPMQTLDARICAIKFCNFDAGVRGFLEDNPFIFMDETHLTGFVFSNSTAKGFQQEYCVPGLSGIVLLSDNVESTNPEFTQLHESPSNFADNSGSIDFLKNLASEKGNKMYFYPYP
jgi:hypothetical protein